MATVHLLEASLGRLSRRWTPGVLALEENAPVGSKRRTLVLCADRGRLQSLVLASDTVSSWCKQRILQGSKAKPEVSLLQRQRALEVLSPEALLDRPTFLRSKDIDAGTRALQVIHTPSHSEKVYHRKITGDDIPFHEICHASTREECRKLRPNCPKLHFRQVLSPNSDVSQGDCSYLSTCHKMTTCKFVHYDFDAESQDLIRKIMQREIKYPMAPCTPKQWVRCDVRNFDLEVLGKFSVIMADPPWEIHQQLPYGTMTDEEMRDMKLGVLMDDGYIFLWVTGRAMELGRECLKIWGYERVDEIIWLKTNQINKIIRTGRTGHWLNHSKEHCIVGVKGNPKFHIGFDCDVVVSEVRETSRKPDELYTMIERLSPGTRKLEIFGREHNLQDGWMTLGNQLPGHNIVEKDVLERFKKRYPNDDLGEKPPQQTPELARSESDLVLSD